MQVSQSYSRGRAAEWLLFLTSRLWYYYLLASYYGADAMIRHIRDDNESTHEPCYKTKMQFQQSATRRHSNIKRIQLVKSNTVISIES